MQNNHSNKSSKSNQTHFDIEIKRLFEEGVQHQYQQTMIGQEITTTSLKHLNSNTSIDFSLPIHKILDHIKAQANL